MIVRRGDLLGLGVAVLLAAGAAAAQGPVPSVSSAAPGPSSAPSVPADPRGEARAHFEKGNALFKSDAIAAALAEFLESRKLYSTMSATSNAALCLNRLQRFDEALDMYESLLKEFADLPEDLRALARREVVRLSGLVGTIEIVGTEPGAAITIDQRNRGEFPAPGPLRVTAGSHVVRVTKEGFEPFETRVEVAGGQTARVVSRLRALAASGRLRVVEQTGKVLEVVVDGGVVGKTPFDGLLGAGDHVVVLRGEGEFGTPPILVHLEPNQVTPLRLAAQELSVAIRVEPTPMNASVAVDAVTVGRGIWGGRLAPGDHKVEVSAPGFLPEVREVSLGRGDRLVIVVALQRDPSSPFWRKSARQGRFTLELEEAVLLAPTFGGGVAGECTRTCSLSLGTGGAFAIHGGYELRSGLGFGITAGYLTVTQASMGRATTVKPVGLGEDQATANDSLAFRGFLVGAWAGLTFDGAFPFHLRLGAGGLFGSLSDTRTGTVQLRNGTSKPFGPATQIHAASFVALTPEVRLGLPLGPHAELNAGLAVPILIAVSRPRWSEAHAINLGSDGTGMFVGPDAGVLLGSALITVAPGVGARYDF